MNPKVRFDDEFHVELRRRVQRSRAKKKKEEKRNE